MSKTSAKANPVNQDQGDRNRGSEPGQEQQPERTDRQNTGNAAGTRNKAENQGRQPGAGQPGPGQRISARREKGDARRRRTR
jgi:hypothetical protein